MLKTTLNYEIEYGDSFKPRMKRLLNVAPTDHISFSLWYGGKNYVFRGLVMHIWSWCDIHGLKCRRVDITEDA